MRSLLKTQLLTLIIITFFLCIPVFTIAATVSQIEEKNEYSTSQAPTGDGGTQLKPVFFGLQKNNEISPELPDDSTKDSVTACPNGFKPARWSLLKRRGSTEWQEVGNWVTQKMNKALQAASPVTFHIWVTFIGSGTPSYSNFEFNWYRNDEIIASARAEDVPLTSGMNPIKIERNAPLVNQSPFAVGDIFKLNIRCQISLSGAQILYGSRAHFSAVEMKSDPLEVSSISGCKNHIKAKYTDAFMVKPNTMTFVAKVDERELESIPIMDFEMANNVNYRTVTWEKKLEPGTYQVEVGISYMGNDNTTVVTLIHEITIKKKPEPTLFGLPVWMAYLIIGIIVIIVIAVVAKKSYSYYEERQWMKQMEMR